MRICFTEVELVPDNGLLKNIEIAGRVCYKSEDKITDTSAKSFVEMIRGRNHLSVLEHGSIYLVVSKETPLPLRELPWCHIEEKGDKIYYYTNFRYICETAPALADIILKGDPLPEWVEFFTPEKTDPYRRWSFRIISNFKISEQYIRHRAFSHSKESSRYCNYAKDRFNNEISIVVPMSSESWFGQLPGILEGIDDKWYFTPDNTKEYKDKKHALASCFSIDEKGRFILDILGEAPALHKVLSRCKLAELDYLEEIQNGAHPENARDLLTLYTKTEQVMTGFAKDWKGLIQKRSGPGVQKESAYIASRIRKTLTKEIIGVAEEKHVVDYAMLDEAPAPAPVEPDIALDIPVRPARENEVDLRERIERANRWEVMIERPNQRG